MAARGDSLRAALSAQPIAVELGGYGFTIPPAPASRWLYALTSPLMEMAVIPGMMDDRAAEMIGALVEHGRVTPAELGRAAYRAIGEAAGRDWWVALRLAGSAAQEDGNVLGELTLRGVDPDAMPLARWCAAVYALLVRNLDAKELMKFQAKLFLVPSLPGIDLEEAEMDDAQVVAMLTGMPGVRLGG